MKSGPLLSRPKLKPQDRPYMDAYYSLAAARSSGFGGAEPIRISEVVAYLDLVGVRDPDERAKYLRVVQHLDHTFLTHARESASRTASK